MSPPNVSESRYSPESGDEERKSVPGRRPQRVWLVPFMPDSHPLRFQIGTRKVPRCGVVAIGNGLKGFAALDTNTPALDFRARANITLVLTSRY